MPKMERSKLFWATLKSSVNRSVCLFVKQRRLEIKVKVQQNFWKVFCYVKKLHLAKIWVWIKSIYPQYTFLITRAKCHLLPTLKFDKQTGNVFRNLFMFVLKIWLTCFKLEAVKIIKMSKRCHKLSQVATVICI